VVRKTLLILIAVSGLGCWGVGGIGFATPKKVLCPEELDSGIWMDKWRINKDSQWGMANVEILDGPAGFFRNLPSGTSPAKRFSKILRVHYPKGSASPAAAEQEDVPLGGAEFYVDSGPVPAERLHLRYYLRFPGNFHFVKGGKLPGLFGGKVFSGGHIPDGTNGFSTRFMWREKGGGEVYAYLPGSVEYGTSLGRGNWRFQPGKWHILEQEVMLNAPGRNNGRIRVWVDEKLVLNQKNLLFRTVGALKIEGIFFSTFFGGKDLSWATPEDTYIDFTGFAVSDKYIGP